MAEDTELGKASAVVKNVYSIIVFIAFVVGLGVTWGTLTSKISTLETNFAEYKGSTKEKVKKLEDQVFQLELNKVTIELTVKNIDKSLVDIKDTLKKIQEGN